MKDRLLNPNPKVDLLNTLFSLQQPALTFRTQSERTELGGPVLARWISKTINLLDAHEVEQFTLDLPTHWHTLVWHTAAFLTNRKVLEENSAVMFITANVEAAAEATWDYEIVLLEELTPLALSCRTELPAGVLDALVEIANYPDYPSSPRPPRELPSPVLPTGKRLLLSGGDTSTVLPVCVAAWARSIHVVWAPELATAPAAQIAAVASAEACDAQLLLA